MLRYPLAPIVAILAFACSVSAPPVPPGPPPEPLSAPAPCAEIDYRLHKTAFTLVLNREGGEGRACRLRVRVENPGGWASVACPSHGTPHVTGKEPLAATEITELVRLTARSRLLLGGHVGMVRGYFAPLDTLMLQSAEGCTVVLVTSENGTFKGTTRRTQLLALLRRIEDRLVARASQARCLDFDWWRSRLPGAGRRDADLLKGVRPGSDHGLTPVITAAVALTPAAGDASSAARTSRRAG